MYTHPWKTLVHCVLPSPEVLWKVGRAYKFQKLEGVNDFGVMISGKVDISVEGVSEFHRGCSGGSKMVGMKDNLCPVIVSISDKVRGEVRERICLGISGSQFVYEVEVKTTKVKGPPCLTTSEVLGHVLVLKIAIVGINVKGKREPFKVVAPIFKGANNCKHLLIIDFVISFSIDH